MDYTTNYHLPQWVETDRVQMEDFNQMCADIDQGITEEREAREAADTALGQTTAQAQASAKAETLKKLRRGGYDLYQMAGRASRLDLFAFPTKSIVVNGLHTAAELGRVSGGLALLEGGGVKIGPSTGLSMERLTAGITDWTDAEILELYGTATAVVKFRSAVQGTITALNVWFHRDRSINVEMDVYIRLYDEDTGAQVYASGKLTSKTLAYTDTQDTLSVAIPIGLNRNYRLEMYNKEEMFEGTFGFGAMGAQALTGTVTAQPETVCTITETLTLETGAEQAVAVVHYSGGDQAPTATLGGQAMTAGTPKAATALDGTACQELEFFLEGSFTGAVTLVVSAQSSASDLTLHDAGAYFN